MWREGGRERICEQWITDSPPQQKKNHKEFVENNQSVWGVVVADSFNTRLYKSFRKWFLSWEVHKISIFQLKKKLNVQTGLVQTPISVIQTQNSYLATEHTVWLYITWRYTRNLIPSLLWSFASSFGFAFSGYNKTNHFGKLSYFFLMGQRPEMNSWNKFMREHPRGSF